MAVHIHISFPPFSPCEVKAQADLAVQIVAGPPGNVNIGSTIGVSVTVSNPVVLQQLLPPENVIATVELRGPTVFY